MARITRRAVPLLLMTTVLAGAGGGVYYYTSYAPPGAKLVADEAAATAHPALSRSDLDAVASAWAATSKEAEDERYAPIPSPSPAPLVDETRSVARGQAPNDEPASSDILDAAEKSVGESPAEADNLNRPTSQRARNAFRDATPKTADDRYSTPSAASPRELTETPSAPPTTNPFAPKSAGSPKAIPGGAQQAAAPMPIAPNDLHAAAPIAPRRADAMSATDIDQREPQPLREPSPRVASADPYSSSPRSLNSGMPKIPDRSSLSGVDNSMSMGGVAGTGKPGERSLEGEQKPALVIRKAGPPEIQVGKAAKFTVQVRNIGGQSATNVMIRDEIPQGTELISTSPRAEVDGSHLVWQLGSLSTGEERTVEIQLRPTAEGDIGSVASVSYAAQASVKTHCTMPQLAIRMTAPKQVMIGQEERVKIELRNPGSGDATGVMLFENVPENVKHPAGPTLEFEIGTLKAGETRQLDLALTAQKAGKVINTLTARADGNLQVQQQIDFEIIAPALQVSLEGPERRYLERPATYQVSVENPGTAPAHDIELVTKLPKGMKFVRANNMGEYDASSHAVYWSLAELPEGEKGTVELVAMPVEAGQQTLEVEGKAQQGLADKTKEDVLVEGLAAIMFEVRDSVDPIEVGGETTYEIRVFNQGSKAASKVQVTVTMPQGLQVVSAAGDTKYATQAGSVVFEPLAQLAPKADTVYRVQVKGVQPGDQRVTVQVNTDDITQPIRREESTRVFGDN